jgi:tetratricopeptide (TPR) repeat protein
MAMDVLTFTLNQNSYVEDMAVFMAASPRSRASFPGYFIIVLLAALCLSGCTRSPAKVKVESLARAVEYEKQEQYASAIIEYKNALKADPGSAETLNHLGEAYLKNAQYKEAYQSFERVLQVLPGNSDAQLAIGQIYLKAGMNDDALQISRELESRNPRNTGARLLLANAYAAKGIISLAVSELVSLTKDEPTLAAAHINLGMFYASQGKQKAAESELQKALEVEPESFNARKALAAIYLSRGQANDAEALYRAALQSRPNSPDELMTLAEFYALENRQSESEQIYKRLVVVQKNSVPSRFALARFYVTQNRYNEARQLDEAIVSETHDFLPARLQLAELALNSGETAKAESILTPLLREQKNNPDVQITEARVLIRERKPQPAIEVLESIIKQGNHPVAHYLLGVAYIQVGNLQRAQNEMESAIAGDSHMTDAYVGLGQMMLNRDQPKVALQYARIALQQAPTRSDCLVLLGSAFANLHDLVSAERYLQAYAAIQPPPPDAFVRLGSLRIMQARYPEALAFFEKAWQLDHRNYGALDGIASTMILKGDKAGAVRVINDVLKQGETPELLSLAGKVYAEAGQFQDAETALKKSLQQSPQSYSDYVQLGSLVARHQRVPEAIAYFETAVKLRPADVGSWTMLGMLNQRQGNLRKSEESYVKALDIEPTAGVAANNLAWLYADQLNDMDKALELARRAKVSLPNVPSVSDTLGWIYTKRRLNEMAVPLLAEAVKSEPKHAEYHYHLAVALMQSGKKSAARQEMAVAERLDSNIGTRGGAKEILQ